MYDVSAQGIDERMINVQYYYCAQSRRHHGLTQTTLTCVFVPNHSTTPVFWRHEAPRFGSLARRTLGAQTTVGADKMKAVVGLTCFLSCCQLLNSGENHYLFVFVSLLLVLCYKEKEKEISTLLHPRRNFALKLSQSGARCTHSVAINPSLGLSWCRHAVFARSKDSAISEIILSRFINRGLYLSVCPISGTPEGSGAHQSLFTTRLLITLLYFMFYTCFTYDTKEKWRQSTAIILMSTSWLLTNGPGVQSYFKSEYFVPAVRMLSVTVLFLSW